MDVTQQLVDLLKERFEGAELHDFGRVPETGKVGGVITWSGFEELDQLERQNLLWQVISERLEGEAIHQISLLLTFTPQELQAIDEGR